MAPSPYLPVSRRFANPIYLRSRRCPSPRRPDQCRPDPSRRPRRPVRGDRNTHRRPARPATGVGGQTRGTRAAAGRAPQPGPARCVRGRPRAEGAGLRDFAPWCAIADEHGPRWQEWPPELQAVRGRASTASSRGSRTGSSSTPGCSGCWTGNWPPCKRRPCEAGMAIGIVHDLAVGRAPGRGGHLGAAGTCWPPVSASERLPTCTTRGPELVPAAVAARGPGRRGVPAVPRHAPHGPAARRWGPGRPRPGAVPAVVDPGGHGSG